MNNIKTLCIKKIDNAFLIEKTDVNYNTVGIVSCPDWKSVIEELTDNEITAKQGDLMDNVKVTADVQ